MSHYWTEKRISVHSKILHQTPHHIQCACGSCYKHAEVDTRGFHSSTAHMKAPTEKHTVLWEGDLTCTVTQDNIMTVATPWLVNLFCKVVRNQRCRSIRPQTASSQVFLVFLKYPKMFGACGGLRGGGSEWVAFFGGSKKSLPPPSELFGEFARFSSGSRAHQPTSTIIMTENVCFKTNLNWKLWLYVF